jgi:hypothetical protein
MLQNVTLVGKVFEHSARCVDRSIAAESEAFLGEIKAELGNTPFGREVKGGDSGYELRDCEVSCDGDFPGLNSILRLENTYFGKTSL